MIAANDPFGPHQPAEPSGACGDGEYCRLAAIAQNEFHNRRRRDRLIRHDIFAEPAWDMLLQLYVAHHRGQTIEAGRLGASSTAAAATAIRWIGTLIEAGLVTSSPPPTPEGDVEISLTVQGVEDMERYLRDILNAGTMGGDIA